MGLVYGVTVFCRDRLTQQVLHGSIAMVAFLMGTARTQRRMVTLQMSYIFVPVSEPGEKPGFPTLDTVGSTEAETLLVGNFGALKPRRCISTEKQDCSQVCHL